MKRLTLILAFAAVTLASEAVAAQSIVPISWVPSPSGTNVQGYVVWIIPPPGPPLAATQWTVITNGLPTASTARQSATLTLPFQPWYIYLTATNFTWGLTSDPSNTVKATPKLEGASGLASP